MKTQIKNLLELQNIDLHIESLLAKEKEIPKQRDKLKIQEKKLIQEIEESEKNHKKLILNQRECERSIAQLQEQIKKYDTQLQGVKKNEEYQALLKEIDEIKKQVGLKEEELIQIMYQIDEANHFALETKKRIEAEIQQLRQQENKIDQELQEVVQERKGLESKRAEAEKMVNAEFLTHYRRIKQRRKTGPVVVPLKDEICSGCFMQVPPQIVNEIMAGEKIHTCRHCGRILYYPDSLADEEPIIIHQES
ncbi:MAG TPA: C4-type zinc ribbon domain-containing protein [Candidatus Hydrogenedens sp.]|nr:C4-type zinc ribbon domain-containing protein [Candidatus Hydrogenedens sp.]HOK08909.1 C4-type zinc ribbon domain-containing protein [Candidatus Hydrogenedens sp.]HOL19588.1 C4-type zinc ribbon domain-containing protein [Candidatus Hydrogenedens sp.]HPP58870.1 C4-type zinc ribbon domain-containing protein [Candidatus Hydrogenedens sp.]